MCQWLLFLPGQGACGSYVMAVCGQGPCGSCVMAVWAGWTGLNVAMNNVELVQVVDSLQDLARLKVFQDSYQLQLIRHDYDRD